MLVASISQPLVSGHSQVRHAVPLKALPRRPPSPSHLQLLFSGVSRGGLDLGETAWVMAWIKLLILCLGMNLCSLDENQESWPLDQLESKSRSALTLIPYWKQGCFKKATVKTGIKFIVRNTVQHAGEHMRSSLSQKQRSSIHPKEECGCGHPPEWGVHQRGGLNHFMGQFLWVFVFLWPIMSFYLSHTRPSPICVHIFWPRWVPEQRVLGWH